MKTQVERKPYAKPIVSKRARLADVAEGDNILVSGTSSAPKGGCFSNRR